MSNLTAYQALKAIFNPLKVLISPFKTFREMTQRSNFNGLVVILVLLLIATTGTQYVIGTKIFLKIDSQFQSVLASTTFGGYILWSLIDMTLVFFTNWLLFGGAMFLLMRAFGERVESLRSFFISISYVFSVFIVRMALTAILMATLPNLILGISSWPPATENEYMIYVNQVNAMWIPTLALQAASFLIWIVYGWFVVLGVAAERGFKEIGWRKAIIISLCAFLIDFIVSSFLGMSL